MLTCDLANARSADDVEKQLAVDVPDKSVRQQQQQQHQHQHQTATTGWKYNVSLSQTRKFLLTNLKRVDGKYAWSLNVALLAHESVMATLRGWPSFNNAVQPFGKPTLFVRGARSNYVRDDDAAARAAHFPRAEPLVTVPNAAHWVHADEPAAFENIVVGFVDAKE